MWGHEAGSGLMGIGMLLVWLLPVALLVWFFARFAGRRNKGGDLPPTPRAILDGRYARGEIDRDEYLARRADLDREGGA